MCLEGYYRESATINTSSFTCEPCLPNAQCDLNSTLASLRVNRGFWRLSSRSRQVLKCAEIRAVQKSDGASSGDAFESFNSSHGRKTSDTNSSNRSDEASAGEAFESFNSSHGHKSSDTNSSGTTTPCVGGFNAAYESICAKGHTGPLCEVCENDGMYFRREAAICEDCPPVIQIVGIVLAAITGVSVLLRCFLCVFEKPQPNLRHFKLVLKRSGMRIRGLSLMPKLKLLVAFFQSVHTLPSVYGVTMPPYYFTWMKAFEWIHFSFDGLVGAGVCIRGGFTTRLFVYSLAPFGVFALVLILASLAYFMDRSLLNTGHTISASNQRGNLPFLQGLIDYWMSALPILLFLSFCMVTSTSQNIFSTWQCAEFSDFPTSRSFMVRDLSVECSGPEYEQITMVALIFVVVWPVGFPILYFVLLWRCRDDIAMRRRSRLTHATRFLHSEYETNLFWWEPVFLIERLAVGGFLLLVPDTRKYARLLGAMLITVAYLIALLSMRPYRGQDLNMLSALGVQFPLMCIFLGALNLQLYMRIEDNLPDDSLAEELMSFESRDQIVGLVLSFIFVVLALFLSVSLYQWVTRKPLMMLVLESTSLPPELTLRSSCRWHLFLSHIWSSGQDQVAVIKIQLRMLLPEVSIFLDVDDLTDIAELETYIDQSQCILIFLSQGYFFSANCMRELEASAVKQKPLRIVHETDTSHGGATLSVLEENCPAELRARIFDSEELISWYRSHDFQALSLLEIAQGLLQASPLYQEAQPFVHISGEAKGKYVSLQKDVFLYASPSNPGASAFVAELSAALTSSTRHGSQDHLHSIQLPCSLLGATEAKIVVAEQSTDSSTPKRRLTRILSTLGAVPGGVTSPVSVDHIAVESMRFHLRLRRFSGKKASKSPSLPSASSDIPCGSDGRNLSPSATVMFLYLNNQTFLNEAGRLLADEVRSARAAGVRILLVHETDSARGGMDFGVLFHRTPEDLIKGGIYKELAIMLAPGKHRSVSYILTSQALDPAKRRAKVRFLFDIQKK